MKTKHLVVLAGAVAALVALRVILVRQDAAVTTTLAGAGLARALPAEVTADAVQAIEVAPPPAAAQGDSAAEGEPAAAAGALRLERSEGGWIVASAHGAPADAAAVDGFVTDLVGLSGELRGQAASVHEAFGVDEGHATAVRLFGAEGKPLATLLLGKAGDRGDSHFVRALGSDDVRHVVKGVRQALALWSEDAKPATDHWVEKKLFAVGAAALASLVVERPDARLVLAKRAAPVPDLSVDGQPAPAPAAPAWEIAEPDVPWPAKTASLAQVVDRAVAVRASKVLAGEACGAGAAAGSLTLAEVGGASHRVDVAGAAPDGGEDLAARVAGSPLCWALSSWSVPALLVRTSAIRDVPPAFADPPTADDVKALTMTRGGRTERWTRSADGSWKAGAGANLEAASVPRVVSTLLSLRFDDLADAARVPKAALAAEAAFVVDAGARRLAVTLLGPRVGATGSERYARVEGPGAAPKGFVGVLAPTTVDALLPPG